jgi:hypothetical protein
MRVRLHEEAVLKVVTAAESPMSFPEVVSALKEQRTERETRAALQRLTEIGSLLVDADLRVRIAPESSEPVCTEEALRQFCVEPEDLDDDPWAALMDALYQKFGAGSEAYDFTEFCKGHAPWFETAARIHVGKQATTRGAVSLDEFQETMRRAANPDRDE